MWAEYIDRMRGTWNKETEIQKLERLINELELTDSQEEQYGITKRNIYLSGRYRT